MKVHVFGNCPSPAFAVYGLRRAAPHGEDKFGGNAKQLGLSATASIDLPKAAQGMLFSSNLRLHKIASNCPDVMRAFPSTDHAKDLKDLDLDVSSPPLQHSLGLSWNLVNNTFTFHVANSEKPFTQRGVLATINSLFDPLGLVVPITIWGAPLPPEKEENSSSLHCSLPHSCSAYWDPHLLRCFHNGYCCCGVP